MSATTVTHADREAAWPYAGFHCLPDRQMRERWFSGYYDNLGQGQAIRDFARHRQQAERAFEERERKLREALKAVEDEGLRNHNTRCRPWWNQVRQALKETPNHDQ